MLILRIVDARDSPPNAEDLFRELTYYEIILVIRGYGGHHVRAPHLSVFQESRLTAVTVYYHRVEILGHAFAALLVLLNNAHSVFILYQLLRQIKTDPPRTDYDDIHMVS